MSSSFTTRSYRVEHDGRSVVCDTVAARDDLDALRDAISWQRDRDSFTELEDAESVLRVRALTAVDDVLAKTAGVEGQTPVTLSRDNAHALCEIAGSYVSERDVESYQAPEERERIALLRGMAGALMDTCSELAAAEREARDKELLNR